MYVTDCGAGAGGATSVGAGASRARGLTLTELHARHTILCSRIGPKKKTKFSPRVSDLSACIPSSDSVSDIAPLTLTPLVLSLNSPGTKPWPLPEPHPLHFWGLALNFQQPVGPGISQPRGFAYGR